MHKIVNCYFPGKRDETENYMVIEYEFKFKVTKEENVEDKLQLMCVNINNLFTYIKENCMKRKYGMVTCEISWR